MEDWISESDDRWQRSSEPHQIRWTVQRVELGWQWSISQFDGTQLYSGISKSASEARMRADRYRLPGGLLGGTSVAVDFTVEPSHTLILQAACAFAESDSELGKGPYEAAVILAQTACEVLTARIIICLARSRPDVVVLNERLSGIAILECLAHLLSVQTLGAHGLSYNLGNPSTRKIYAHLSGDDIGRKPGSKGSRTRKQSQIYPEWWDRLAPTVTLRNDVVHQGDYVRKDQALEACQVAQLLITHLEGIATARDLFPKPR